MVDKPPPVPRTELPFGPPPGRWLVWLIGMLVADAITGVLFVGVRGLLTLTVPQGNESSVVLPSLVLLPLLNGLLAAFCWRRLEPTVGQIFLQTLGLTFLNLVGAAACFHEGIICLIIASPALYLFVLCGGLIGRVLFHRDSSRLRLSVLPLLVLAITAEPFTRTEQPGIVTDEVLIHAPPARVWPQITSFPAIPAPPRFWLFKLGLPYPVATTSAGDFQGADRRCIFSRDAVFKETVARIVPGQELTFDIVEIPPDPELLGHLTPHRGQFLLRDNGDGTTTLVGSTWYTLHVRPLWYFDWWTQQIFRQVHLRVMEDVKRRAES